MAVDVRSWSQRLRSIRNQLSMQIANRIRYSRGLYVEPACRQLSGLPPSQQNRIDQLRRRYAVAFEASLREETSINNYAYLDLLDRAWSASGAVPPRGGVVADVGCASFWYVATLHTFFRPRQLTGYELEAFRRYANGHTRQDYAQGYSRAWPETVFRVQDYRSVEAPANLVTCWFPFLSETSALAWGLPLNLLKPKELFYRISENIKPAGGLFMVNHGAREADDAAALCDSVGLTRQWVWTDPDPLRPRPQPPVASYWQH